MLLFQGGQGGVCMSKRKWVAPQIVSVSALPAALGHCYIGDSEMPGDETAGGGCFSGQSTGLDRPHTCNTGGFAGGMLGCVSGQQQTATSYRDDGDPSKPQLGVVTAC